MDSLKQNICHLICIIKFSKMNFPTEFADPTVPCFVSAIPSSLTAYIIFLSYLNPKP